MEEFEIHGEDEVEVVPMSPLRRLEKRLEAIEKSNLSTPGHSNYMVKEMLETMKTSQKLVDDIVLANHKLVEEMEKTNSKISELIDLIKTAGEMETGVSSEAFKPIVEKLDKLIESNENLSISLEDAVKKGRSSSSSSVPTKIKLPYPPKHKTSGV